MSTAKGKKKKWYWILLGVAVVAAAAVIIVGNALAAASSASAYSTYTVSAGSIESTITGSGRLESGDSMDVELPSGITVDEVMVRVGDRVSAGDVLATLDEASLEYRMSELTAELEALDRQIMNRTTVNGIYSPVKGRIKALYAVEGDDVQDAMRANGMVALLSSDGLMEIAVETDATVSDGAALTVEWADGSVESESARKTAAGYVVMLPDDSAPYNETAKVYDGEKLIGEGTLNIHAPVSVYGTGGTVDELNFDVNDSVKMGAKLITLADEPASGSYTRAVADRDDKLGELNEIISYMSDARVLAPSDGVVAALSVADGTETVASGMAGVAAQAAFVLHTGGAVKMNISVDELDVGSVALDQAVKITLDAYAGEAFDAKVTHISKLGAPAGSITTYSVELLIEYDERLLEGMNGSAVITANRVDNVLVIPIAAILEDSTGTYVYVKGGEGEENARVDITTGLSDGTNAEVTGGLSAGDVIVYSDGGDKDMMFMFGGMRGMNGAAKTSAAPLGGE